MSLYKNMIEKISDYDSRWVEAWMRLDHGTLDGLSSAGFKKAIADAEMCIDATTDEDNEGLALSFAL